MTNRGPQVPDPEALAADPEARLIKAAQATFYERGYRDATLQEISGRAGLTTGSVYSRFSGKEELFLAATANRTAQQQSAWEAYMSSAVFGGEQATDLGKALLSSLPDAANYRAYQEFRSSALSEKTRAILRREDRLWREVLERVLDVHCRLTGRTPQIPLSELALPVAALINGLLELSAMDPEIDIGGVLLSTLDHLLRT